MSEAHSCNDLCRVVQLWYRAIAGSPALTEAVGFDAHMQRGDWARAKASIVRSYGESSLVHRGILEALDAALYNGRLLGCRNIKERVERVARLGKVL